MLLDNVWFAVGPARRWVVAIASHKLHSKFEQARLSETHETDATTNVSDGKERKGRPHPQPTPIRQGVYGRVHCSKSRTINSAKTI